MEKIKIQLIKVREIIRGYWLRVPEKYRKILIIVAGAFALLVILMILLSLILALGKKTTKLVKKATPVPVVQTTFLPEAISNPSRYATDAGVLKIETDLTVIGKELDGLSVNEVDLLPVRLDFSIDFEE
jgi:hypothetical protein